MYGDGTYSGYLSRSTGPRATMSGVIQATSTQVEKGLILFFMRRLRTLRLAFCPILEKTTPSTLDNQKQSSDLIRQFIAGDWDLSRAYWFIGAKIANIWNE